MGIKAGSGKGGVDRGGGKDDGSGGGSFSGKGNKPRRKIPFAPPPPKEPYQPVPDSPFPENKGLKLGQYRVVEERDDYLICRGFDPNAKDPFAEITPAAYRTIKVAKPPALQRTPWDGQTVTIGGVDYTYTYSDTEYGVRTASSTNGDEEQRIDVPYTLDTDVTDQIIVAVEIQKNAGPVQGMEVTDEDGTRLRWMDLNVSGRKWEGPSSTTAASPANFTIAEFNPATGVPLGYMDRGRRRFGTSPTDVADRQILYSSDGFLYAAGQGWLNGASNGVVVKWDPSDYTEVWRSTEGAHVSPGAHLSSAGVISGALGNSATGSTSNKVENPICEASDGKIWLLGGTVSQHIAAYDPATGAQVVDISGIIGDAIYPADSSGSVLVVDAAGTGGKYLRVFNSSGTETASWSTHTLGWLEVFGSVLVLANAATTTLRTLNCADLTEISNRSAPAGETYIAGCTDGTNVYVSCAHATTPKYRKYLVSNLATEDASSPQNRDTTSNASFHMKHKSGFLYDWAQHLRKIDASALTEVWEIAGDGIAPTTRRQCAVGTSYVYWISASTSSVVLAVSISSGLAAWTEQIAGHVIYTTDDRLFICGSRLPT